MGSKIWLAGTQAVTLRPMTKYNVIAGRLWKHLDVEIRGSRILEACFWRFSLLPDVFLGLSLLPGHPEVSTLPKYTILTHDALVSLRPATKRPSGHGQKL